MYATKSEGDTYAFGAALGAILKEGDTVLLYGELGAGKSVLARGCARALGVKDAMASPTFTLMQPYAGDNCPVYHFDLYRLSSEDEFYAAGLDEYLGCGGVSLVEWPQQADISQEPRIEIDIWRAGEANERNIDLCALGLGARGKQLLSALRPWEVSEK